MGVQDGKVKAIKVTSSSSSVKFFKTSTELSMIQKQLTPCVPGDPFAILLGN